MALNRYARLAGCVLLGVWLAVAVAACGSTTNQLATSLSTTSTGGVKPGDVPSYTVKVVNRGPGLVTGVTVHVDLPSSFKYKATTSVDGHGEERTQLTDAALNSQSPEWGLWSLPAPAVQADGTTVYGELDLTFTADAEGPPGDYAVNARASSDSTEGAAESPPLAVTLDAAPHLAMVIAASPGNIHPTNVITYRVTVTNDGSGPASAVRLLITLPAAFEWQSTLGVSGNASHDVNGNPVKNTSLVDYGEYTVPARSDAGPGVLVITFKAKCLPSTPSGSYPVSGQLSADGGFVLDVPNTVPVNVIA